MHPMTWVQYAVKKMMKSSKESLVWIDDLKCIDECKKFMDIEMTQKSVEDCIKTWNHIKNSLKVYKKSKPIPEPGAEDKYVKKFGHFVEETKPTMVPFSRTFFKVITILFMKFFTFSAK